MQIYLFIIYLANALIKKLIFNKNKTFKQASNKAFKKYY